LAARPLSVGVFVPGVAAGSPLYEQMANAAQKVAQANPGMTVKVVEGGFNQGDWPEKVTSTAATGYVIILTSNPSLPAICQDVAKSFPNQKFIIMDSGVTSGIHNFYAFMYNQVEQGYIAGYLAALMTRNKMPAGLKIGAIVAQEYPALNKEIIPGCRQGARAVNPKFTLDYRVIGNWYDANKAGDLANSMMDAGVNVILAIAGGAGQGIIKAAQARDKYVICFGSDQYAIAPGTIIGCATLNQYKAVTEALGKAVNGTLPFGTAVVVNAKDGYVDLADTSPMYTKNVPASVRNQMDSIMKKFRISGFSLPIPQL
jgi:simple sugar transport system substrate-binding protein